MLKAILKFIGLMLVVMATSVFTSAYTSVEIENIRLCDPKPVVAAHGAYVAGPAGRLLALEHEAGHSGLVISEAGKLPTLALGISDQSVPYLMYRDVLTDEVCFIDLRDVARLTRAKRAQLKNPT